MSALDAAQGRLDAALDRLEGAVEQFRSRRPAAPSPEAPPAQAPELVAELDLLRGECRELRLALDEASSRRAELEAAAREVNGRLDRAIDEIATILDG